MVISVCVGAILDLCGGRFGHPKRPNTARFGLITWAVFEIRVGRFGHFPHIRIHVTGLGYAECWRCVRRRPSAVQWHRVARPAASDSVDLRTWWPAERCVSQASVDTARTLASHDRTCTTTTIHVHDSAITSLRYCYCGIRHSTTVMMQSAFCTVCRLLNSFLKSAFPSIWLMRSKYSTKQHTFALLSSKQMSKI